MTALAEHSIYEQRAVAGSKEIAAVVATLELPVSYLDMVVRLTYLTYLCRKMLNSLDALEKSGCVKCTISDCKFPVQNQLRPARNALRLMQKHDAFPWFFNRQIRSIVERMDDKLENYALASDPEIKGMMASLSQRHARA